MEQGKRNTLIHCGATAMEIIWELLQKLKIALPPDLTIAYIPQRLYTYY